MVHALISDLELSIHILGNPTDTSGKRMMGQLVAVEQAESAAWEEVQELQQTIDDYLAEKKSEAQREAAVQAEIAKIPGQAQSAAVQTEAASSSAQQRVEQALLQSAARFMQRRAVDKKLRQLADTNPEREQAISSLLQSFEQLQQRHPQAPCYDIVGAIADAQAAGGHEPQFAEWAAALRWIDTNKELVDQLIAEHAAKAGMAQTIAATAHQFPADSSPASGRAAAVEGTKE